MTTIHVEAHFSADDLLKAIEQLENTELERFVERLIDLKAQRSAPSLSEGETELLSRINRGLPSDLADRYRRLIEKRRAASLLPEEHEELLRLSDQTERLEAERVEALAELARLRGTSLTRLMSDLGIQAPPDA
jgi:DNA repair photolyase